MIRNSKNKISFTASAIITIVVMSTVTLFVFYKQNDFPKCEHIPDMSDCSSIFEKCYYADFDIRGCFTIFQKGYWVKPPYKHYSLSSSLTRSIISTVKNEFLPLSALTTGLIIVYIYIRKHVRK